MNDTTCYIVFFPDVPEYFRADVNNSINHLIEWYFDYDVRSKEDEEKFKNWLEELPLGKIVVIPTKPDYFIVKCEE